jgi:hypothetical protein
VAAVHVRCPLVLCAFHSHDEREHINHMQEHCNEDWTDITLKNLVTNYTRVCREYSSTRQRDVLWKTCREYSQIAPSLDLYERLGTKDTSRSTGKQHIKVHTSSNTTVPYEYTATVVRPAVTPAGALMIEIREGEEGAHRTVAVFNPRVWDRVERIA